MNEFRKLLSRRELEVVQALCAGKTNKEIAIALGIREATVKVHFRNIGIKLNLRNRIQVAVWAAHHELDTKRA